MAKLFKIVKDKIPSLRGKCLPVENPSDPAILELINEMHDYLVISQDEEYASKHHIREGVGLAAPQVALSKRVFVAECNGSQILPGPLPFLALFNPVVDTNASKGKEPVRVQEGCLSVPDMRAVVSRPSDVTVSFYDIFQQRRRRIHATGCLFIVHMLIIPFYISCVLVW